MLEQMRRSMVLLFGKPFFQENSTLLMFILHKGFTISYSNFEIVSGFILFNSEL